MNGALGIVVFVAISIVYTTAFFTPRITLKQQAAQRFISNIKIQKSYVQAKNSYRLSSVNRLSRLRFKVADVDEDVDEDEELDFDGDGKPSSLLKKLSNSIVPLAASVGFAVTPSSAVAVRIAGLAAGGVAGFIAKKVVIDKLVENEDSDGGDDDGGGGTGSGGGFQLSVEVENVLETLSSGPPPITLTLEKLEKIAKKCRVPSEQLGELFTVVFAGVVVDAVSSPSTDLTELNEVIDFAADIGLSPEEIGDGFTLAAAKLGRRLERDSRGFFSQEYEPDLLLHAAKVRTHNLSRTALTVHLPPRPTHTHTSHPLKASSF